METSDIIASLAVFIAVLSFAVTIWQGYISRKHNQLSVKPHLYIDLHVEKDAPTRLIIKNNGLGPAFIKDFKILVDGKALTSEDKLLYHQALKDINLEEYDFSYSMLSDNQAFPAGAEIDLYSFETEDLDSDDVKTIEKNLERLDFEIDYESIYNIKYQYYEKNHLTRRSRGTA